MFVHRVVPEINTYVTPNGRVVFNFKLNSAGTMKLLWQQGKMIGQGKFGCIYAALNLQTYVISTES